ncbi:MAG: histidine kinase [Chitinophagales bacterium]
MQENFYQLLAEGKHFLKTDKQKAVPIAKQATEIAAALNDDRLMAQALLLKIRANEVFGYYNQEGLEAIATCLELTARNGFTLEQLTAYNLKITHLLSVDTAAADVICNEAEQLAATASDDEEMDLQKLNLRYNRLQLCISFQKNLEEAFELANQSLAEAERLNSYDNRIAFLQVLAVLNAQQGNNAASAKFLEELILLAIEKDDAPNVAGAAGYLAFLYYGLGNMEKAEACYEQSEQYALKAGNVAAMFVTSLRRIRMYTESFQTEKAGLAIAALEQYVKETDRHRDRNLFLIYKADYLSQTGACDQAVALLETVALHQEFMNDKLEAVQVFQRLHQFYHVLNDHQNAYRCFSKFYEIRSEIMKEENAKNLAELQARYDAERKESQLREAKFNQLNAELKAIRSQMNPHFVFNVMSTVDALIAGGNSEKARESLHTFARLMRTTLHHSQDDFTLLEEEIDLLENYIQLEKLSLGEAFHHQITIGENVDPDYDRLPALLLQPLVENAIKHGLRHQIGEKLLRINFTKTDEALCIQITDNGIGRKASAALQQTGGSHRSFATEALTNRLRFLNQQVGFEKYSFKITDLEQGTEAMLRIQF